MRFLHHPTQKIIETDNHSQTLRYRRSSRFTELSTSPSDSDYHYHSPTSSPQSPRQSATTPSDQPTKAHETHTIAPDAPEPVFDDLPLTDIDNHTVSQVLAWVNNNPTRARQALQTEQAGRNRVTLTSKLRRIT